MAERLFFLDLAKLFYEVLYNVDALFIDVRKLDTHLELSRFAIQNRLVEL